MEVYPKANRDLDVGMREKGSFILNYTAKGRLPETATKIVDMAMNASSIRDAARVLGISPTTVINKLKQQDSTLSLVGSVPVLLK